MSSINEEELRAKLDPLSSAVLREGATERPFTGEYTDTETVGSYLCKACGSELFRSETKFHSGCEERQRPADDMQLLESGLAFGSGPLEHCIALAVPAQHFLPRFFPKSLQ